MRRGNVCGACAGALMVLGLMYGETHAGDREGRRRTDRLNDLMMDRFSRANGSCLCNWTREPKHFTVTKDRVEIITEPHTDLWQRTYLGCYKTVQEGGYVFGFNAGAPGDVKNTDALQKAYEMGKALNEGN